MKEIVEVIAKALVDRPEAVEVSEEEQERATLLKLHVAEDDMGKVIGKQGRIAKAMRTVVKAAATRENKKVTVEILSYQCHFCLPLRGRGTAKRWWVCRR